MKNIKDLSTLQRIRRYCLLCSGDSPKEVRLCPIGDCPLYDLRMGRNPKRKGVGPGLASINKKKRIESDKNHKKEGLNDAASDA